MKLRCLALSGALLVLASPPAAQAKMVFEKLKVPTVGGATMNVEIARDDSVPTSAVLLTLSPYNTLSEGTSPNIANDSYAARYASKGIARAKADVLGTRDSTGCWDYGGAKEQQSGVDVVKALAAQPWSNGKVAMIGGSYDGTTATMVAARGDDVPELTAIVPLAAISRWYGYAYQDGVRYLGNGENATDEGFDTPLAFDFGFGRTVGPGVTSDQRALQDRLNPCESVEHTVEAYNRSPDYDDFWLQRDYRKDAAKFRAAVLIGHGWQDYNVKQEEAIGLWEALPDTVFKRMYLTQGRHSSPSGSVWQSLLDGFLFKFLLGQDTGVEQTPAVLTTPRLANDNGFQAGQLRPEASWPPAGTTEKRLWIRRVFDNDIPGVTLPDPGTGETGTLSEEPNTETKNNFFSWFDVGATTEEFTTRDPLNEPGHGYYSLFFKSEPLAAPMRIAGTVVLDGHFRTFEGAHITPVLVDIAPDGTMRTIARGFLNMDYRDGMAKAKPVFGQWVRARVRFLPQDVILAAGHRLGLLTQSSNTVWAVPGNPGQVNIATGPVPGATTEGSSLRIPVAPTG